MTILIHKKGHGHCINGKFEHAQIVFRQPCLGSALTTGYSCIIPFQLFSWVPGSFWTLEPRYPTTPLFSQFINGSCICSFFDVAAQCNNPQLGIQQQGISGKEHLYSEFKLFNICEFFSYMGSAQLAFCCAPILHSWCWPFFWRQAPIKR